MTERPHLQDAHRNAPRDGHKRTGEELAAEDVRGNRILASGVVRVGSARGVARRGGAVCLGRLCPRPPRPLTKRMSSGLTGQRRRGQR